MPSLRARWADCDNPDDAPEPGEAVGRLVSVSREEITVPGGGRLAPSLRYDASRDDWTWTEPRPTDLHIGLHRYVMTVTAYGLPPMMAWLLPDADAPVIPVDAPADLRGAAMRLWAARGTPGRPSRRRERVAAILAATVELGDAATRLKVAQKLGRVHGLDGAEEDSGYKEDVRAAGGWQEIRRRAGL